MVVVHPPFRWQRGYSSGFVEGIADLERRTGIAFAVENMYPWRATSRREMKVYQPGWDPSEERYANTTTTCRTPPRPAPTRSRWPSVSATASGTCT